MKEVTIDNFEEEVLNSKVPCVVKFTSDHCHLCHGLVPIMESTQEKFNKFNFYNVDTEKEETLTKIFSDDGVPTIYFFVNGDGTEIPYPADENSGYDEKTLRNFFNVFTSGKLKIV